MKTRPIFNTVEILEEDCNTEDFILDKEFY